MNFIKNIWNNRYTYAQYLAIAATLLNAAGLLALFTCKSPSFLELLGCLAVILGLVLTLCAYCLGGLWTAVKSALGIAAWGWLVIPFPYDIATGLAAFVIALAVLFLIPIIPVSKALKEHQVQCYIAQQTAR